MSTHPPGSQHPDGAEPQTETPNATPTPTLPTTKPQLKMRFTADELASMTIPEPIYVLPGILATGLGILSGKPKLGKSWFSLNLAVALAYGDNFLSQDLEAGNVLYLSLEDNHRRLNNRLEQSLDGRALPKNLELWLEAPEISAVLLEQMEEWVTRTPKPKLIIIDPLGRVMPSKGQGTSDYEAATKVLATLQAFAFKHNLCVLFIHHTRKNIPEGSDVFDAVLGSIGINGVMDTILVLDRKRDQEAAALHITGRDIDERSLHIVFDGESGIWSLGEDDPLRHVSEAQLEVLKALFGGHGSHKALTAATGKSPSNVSNMLKRLADKGLVKKAGSGAYLLSSLAQRALSQRGESSENGEQHSHEGVQDGISVSGPGSEWEVNQSDMVSDPGIPSTMEDDEPDPEDEGELIGLFGVRF